MRVNFPHKACLLSLPNVPSWPGILREMAERRFSDDFGPKVMSRHLLGCPPAPSGQKPGNASFTPHTQDRGSLTPPTHPEG